MSSDGKPAEHDRFPPFGGLKSFYELALMGSAVRAAERLNVSASSISHQVKTLERELGIRLVENRKGRLHLTVDGVQFFERIKAPMTEILKASEAMRSAPGRRRVSLTLTPSFAAGWLMPRLLDLDRKHPDLEINLITTTRVVDLEKENVDLAIRRGEGGWDGIIAEPLLKETVVPVVAPNFLDASDQGNLEKVLGKSRALVNTTLEGEWDTLCSACGVTPPAQSKRYNLETYELTIQAARDGLGIALGRRPLVDPLLESGELVAPVELPDVGNMSYFVVRREGSMRSDVKRLFNWLKSQGH